MIRTLHIDIEGGWGGSSRSLFELVSRLDRARFAPLVIHRRDGPIAARYAALGIPTVHVPEVPSFAPRPHNSAKIFLANLPAIARKGRAARRIAGLAREHGAGIIHLNYEGLFVLAPDLVRLTALPMVVHGRTMVPDNRWGRWMVRTLGRHGAYALFISPQEEARFRALEEGPRLPGEVLWNIATPPRARRPVGEVPEAVYLGNLAVTKGPDRLVDVAAALDARGAPPLAIAVYGSARGDPAYAAALERTIARRGLGHRIRLAGHVGDPERVLAGAFALIRPSRDNDPWGRDVIEAEAAGVPVLASGTFDGVVQPGVTGYLFDPFDAEAVAARLVAMLADPASWRRLSEAARELGRRRFGGAEQVARVGRLFEELAGGRARAA